MTLRSGKIADLERVTRRRMARSFSVDGVDQAV
jgi:hypothetical protein